MSCSKEAGEWLFGKKVVGSSRYMTVPNAIDTKSFAFDADSRNQIRKELDIPKNSRAVVTVGRMTPPKNPPGIIEICKALSRKCASVNDVRFIWVGTGEDKDWIEDEVRKSGLSEIVRLTGVRSDVNKIMMGADIFILPSLWEGLPVVAVEAQAAGLPCLLSDRISKEVGITGLVRYLSIDHGYDTWADAILEEEIKRLDVTEQIKEAGFDVESSAKYLQDFYLNAN